MLSVKPKDLSRLHDGQIVEHLVLYISVGRSGVVKVSTSGWDVILPQRRT